MARSKKTSRKSAGSASKTTTRNTRAYKNKPSTSKKSSRRTKKYDDNTIKTKRTKYTDEQSEKSTPKSNFNNKRGIIMLLLGILFFFVIDLNVAGYLSDSYNYVLGGLVGQVKLLIPIYLIAYGAFEIFKRNYIKGVRKNVALCLILFSIFLFLGTIFVSTKITPSFETLGNAFTISAKGNGVGLIINFFLMLLIPVVGKIFLIVFSVLLLIFSLLIFNKFKLPSFFEYVEVDEDGKELKTNDNASILDKVVENDEREKAFTNINNDFEDEESVPFADRVNIKTFDEEKNSSGTNKNFKKNLKENIFPDDINTPNIDGENLVTDIKPPLNLGSKAKTEKQKENIEIFEKGLDDKSGEFKINKKSDFDPFAPENKSPDIDLRVGAYKNIFEDDINENVESNISGSMGSTGSMGSKRKYKKYRLPSIDLLDISSSTSGSESKEHLKAMGERLEQVLSNFNVRARVKNIIVGPTVSRYEVVPEIGVKISSVKALESDLALNLGAKSVRVVAMHSESMIGIEAYNDETKTVSLRSIFSSTKFRTSKSITSFALGKNISGENIISDLKNMPHLLIAGTTGSGKSVCINCILLSLLFKASPDDLKLILIDPKVVELEAYNDLPHLLMPVINNADKASIALSYAVNIMEERYSKFSSVGVREIESYNNYVEYENKKLESENEEQLEKMPKIVIVIDELADLMMVASAKVQDSITRLAQKARACGINLIVATQQPLSSILTSIIKANVPSRIAFAVSSATASRVILDKPGAEKLLGKGDMLFSPIGTREPLRVQGAFVSDSEIRRVMEFIKEQKMADFSEEDIALENIKIDENTKKDELLDEVIEFVKEQRKASTSLIQRRFRIGYNRAANIIDDLEEMGIIGPQDGSRPRDVLV